MRRHAVVLTLALISAAGSIAAHGCKSSGREGEPRPPAAAAPPIEAAPPSLPPLRLIVVGDVEGTVEPCGCTVRPAGGLDRLATAVERLRKGADASLVVVAGNVWHRADSSGPAGQRQQDAWSDDLLSAVLARLRVDAVAPGALDLASRASRIDAWAREAGAPALVGTSLGAPEIDALRPGVVLRAGSQAVGVTAAMRGAGDTVESLTRESARLRRNGAEMVVAAVHGAVSAAPSIADVIVQTGVNPGPAELHDGALIIRPDHHTEGLFVVDLWPARAASSGSRPAWRLHSRPPLPDERSEPVAVARRELLDRAAPSDPEVRKMLDQLFARIGAHNAQAAQATPPARPPGGAVPHAPEYVGSKTCAACHTPAYFWWLRTPHGRALASLQARGRALDLDCIGCHVTGFDEPGGATVGRLADREGVGCESCHGPGERHTENPQQQPHRAIERVVPERRCAHCHDPQHSVGFDYARARMALGAAAHTVPAQR